MISTRVRPTRERGSATVFVLGLCVGVLFLGGLALDLWRAVAVRRELAAMADAAATAAADGLDRDALRSGGVHLDAGAARAIAVQTLGRDDRVDHLTDVGIRVDGDAVTVLLEDEVPVSLLGIFAGGEVLTVRVAATARPDARP